MSTSPDRDAAEDLIRATLDSKRTGNTDTLNALLRSQAGDLVLTVLGDQPVSRNALQATVTVLRRFAYLALLGASGFTQLPEGALDNAVLHLRTTVSDASFGAPGA